jgi:hypothetical protein
MFGSLAGFFDSDSEYMRGARLRPAVGQPVLDRGGIGRLQRRQSPQYIGQIRCHIQMMQPGALHDRK